MSDIPSMLREIGRRRRTEGQMVVVRRELQKRQRRAQTRHKTGHKTGQVLNALGYLIVVAAAVIVILSL